MAPDQANHFGLGLFSRLPERVREMIWEELMPQGSGAHHNRNLRILRASRPLYGEIAALLYENSTVRIGIASGPVWCRVQYRRWGRLNRASHKITSWTIDSSQEFRLRGFAEIPIRRVAQLEVFVNVSYPPWMAQIVGRTASLFQTFHDAVGCEAFNIRCTAYDDGNYRIALPSNTLFSPLLPRIFPIFIRLDHRDWRSPLWSYLTWEFPPVATQYNPTSRAIHSMYRVQMRVCQPDLRCLQWHCRYWENLPNAIWYDPTSAPELTPIIGWIHRYWYFWRNPSDADYLGRRANWIMTGLTQDGSAFIEFHRAYWQVVGRCPGALEYDRDFWILSDMHLAFMSFYDYLFTQNLDPQGLQNRKPRHAVFRLIQPVNVHYDAAVAGRYREYMRLYGYSYEANIRSHGGMPTRRLTYSQGR